MADANGATEDSLTPENLSMKPHTNGEPVSANLVTINDMVRAEAVSADAGIENHTVRTEVRDNSEPCVAKLTSNKGPRQALGANIEDRDQQNDDVVCVFEEIPVKPEPEDEEMEEEVKIKKEFEEGDIEGEPTIQNFTDSPLVGKLKIKPMASLVETTPPNPQPGLHPFFAGFDDHIRSLIINRQPELTMNPALLHQPGRFMYYDNSTNMNLKKMLNGHRMAQIPAPRHQYRPYVPINVPRPPRSQPFRSSFSTQTPPMFMGPNVPGTPSTSYQWLPQSRPPVPNFPPKIDSQNVSVKNISKPTLNEQLKLNLPQANMQLPPNSTSFNNSSAPTMAPPNNSMNSVTPQSKKVSTSSSTDDLENHSSENAVTFKTEIDLGIDTKEELHATLGAHFMDSSESVMPSLENFKPIEVTTGEPQRPIPISAEHQRPVLTGDIISPVKEPPKRNPAYELPTYSTKGWLLCKCCDFRCNRRKKMKEHFDTMHTAENQFKCFYCVKNLAPIIYHKSIHDLEHHVAKVHRGEKRWQCKGCSKTYKCRASLKAHREKTCSVSHPYACHMCTFTCITEASLEKHIKSHEKIQETELCPFCNKTFKRLYMKTHLITVHAPPEEKPFHCMSCDYAAGAQNSLDSHYRRTGHDKKFKCNHCEYSCRSHSILKDHINIVHSDPSKPVDPNKLTCGVDGCKVKCLSGRSLKAHRKLHLIPDSQLFTCPDQDCLRKFQTKRLLQLHLGKTAHHKPFKCTDCSLRFLKEESVNHHIQSVHVNNILKRMERVPKQEPVCVKNVVDVYNWVGGAGNLETSSGSIRDIDNFGCWLGISGFGDIKTDCDNEPSLADITENKMENEEAIKGDKIENEEAFKGEKNEKEEPDQGTSMEDDDEYENLVPITCLVEVKQEDNELNVGNTGYEEIFVKKEEDEDDTDYQYVNPELSNLVECQQNLTTDTPGDHENPEVDCLPTSLVKVGLGEGNASKFEH